VGDVCAQRDLVVAAHQCQVVVDWNELLSAIPWSLSRRDADPPVTTTIIESGT
jgi:hypothetical protein